LHYHLVLSTKHREPFITADLQGRLYEYLGGILRGHDGCLLAAGGMPDHIHLRARLSKEMSMSEALCLLKCSSSKWVHETFPEHQNFAWQTGYGAFAVSLSGWPAVKRYLATQTDTIGGEPIKRSCAPSCGDTGLRLMNATCGNDAFQPGAHAPG
jgi:REP element-mobilizing transposase RayT